MLGAHRELGGHLVQHHSSPPEDLWLGFSDSMNSLNFVEYFSWSKNPQLSSDFPRDPYPPKG